MTIAHTRIEKLRAMAADTSSPHEAETARKMLEDLGVPVVPPAKEPEKVCAFRGCTQVPVPNDRGLVWVCKRHQQDMGFSPPRATVPDPFGGRNIAEEYSRLARAGRYREAAALGVKEDLRPAWARPIEVKVDAPFD